MGDSDDRAFVALVAAGVTDPDRLAAVRATALLDTGPEDPFEQMALLVAELLGVPIAFVTVVDDRRSYWKACVGIGGPEPADRQNPVEESFCQYVIGLGAPLLIEDARVDTRTKRNRTVTERGLVAWAGHPIVDSDGMILGTFCAVDFAPRIWSDRDARVLQVFADAVSSEIDLRATALRSRLLTESTLRLADLAGEMSGAETSAEVAEVVVRLAGDVVDARLVNVGLLDAERRAITLLSSQPIGSTGALSPQIIPADSPAPLAVAMRDATWVHATDGHDHDHHVAGADDVGNGSTLAVPLFRRDGTVLGALGFGWSTTREVSEADRGVLRTLATLCGQSFERSLMADVRVDLITQLQTSLLPRPDVSERLDVAVRYLPANDLLGLGGDWYDIVDVGGHRLQVVIGDVVGHGVEAAARMAQVQGVLSALIRIGTPLDEVFVLAERALGYLGEGYLATIDMTVVDPDADVLHHVSAGHPPPVLWTPTDGARLLAGGRRRLLGHPVATGPIVETLAFPPGSVLVSYTDGLIERRGQGFEDEIRPLLEHLDSHHAEAAGSIADGLLRSCLGDEAAALRRDDTALAVVVHSGRSHTEP